MDAKDHPVISVLGDQRRFVVPIYQRQYRWGEPRLLPFWEDVVAKAEEAQQGKPKFSHYMGALILAPGGDGFTIGTTPRVQVVDGQQRLTTFQIFLVALREVGNELKVSGIDETINDYLYVRLMSGDSETEGRFKLIPTPEDRAVFHAIVQGGVQAVQAKYPTFFFQNGNVRKTNAPLSVSALDFFIKGISKYVQYGLNDDDPPQGITQDDDEESQLRRLNSLLQSLLNYLKLVVITLSDNDDAQVIFETLNSQAEPLLAMDLVRNNIFHRASAQGESAESLFETKWKTFDAPFWKADSPRAKPKRPRIDHFLSHALTAHTGEETSLRELYAEYRAFTRPKGKPRFSTVTEELEALTTFAPIYLALEERGAIDPSLNRLGDKLNLWEVSTAYPLIFRIAPSDADLCVKSQLYTLIYSYLVRRAICGLTPKNLNKTFCRLVAAMRDNGVSIETFANAFAGQRGDAVRFPDDAQLRAAIKKPVYNFFQRKERLNDILWELEIASRDKFNVNTPRPLHMSIEHILPQKWTTNWPLPDGRSAPADKITGADQQMLTAISIRDSALHSLGNLTLNRKGVPPAMPGWQ